MESVFHGEIPWNPYGMDLSRAYTYIACFFREALSPPLPPPRIPLLELDC